MGIATDKNQRQLKSETIIQKKYSGLNFLKDTNVIQNLVWSISSGMMVAKRLSVEKFLHKQIMLKGGLGKVICLLRCLLCFGKFENRFFQL